MHILLYIGGLNQGYIQMCVVDLNSKVQSLLERIEKLETEKQQIREEFGHQRAKMKELYLQKEGIFILKSARNEWIFVVLNVF